MKILQRIFGEIVSNKNQNKKMILSGENPLMVFISSVMNDEMSRARERLTFQIKNLMGFIPWTFEFTPASSEDVEEGYLRKVREADFVVWLVGSETRPAVQKEIREALFTNKRLLIFRMPIDDQRDEKTQQLLSEVGLRAKYYDLSDYYQLTTAFEKSISDEMIRAVRGKPGLSRIAKINEIFLGSRARCIERWQASGINLEKAMELFDNKNIGKPSLELVYSLQSNNLVVLSGDFGSGKSLMAERLLQQYITDSYNDTSKPLPIYIKANNLASDLKSEVLDLSESLGNPRICGAFIVIDGVDETNLSEARKILSQARILARTWANTSIIITSRPLQVFSELEEKINMNLLGENEIVDLINNINGSDVDSRILRKIPPSIRNAIQRPLFAIIWAKYLRSKNERIINTTGELLNFFIEDVIPFSHENISSSINLLELLAIKTVDNGGDYVAWRKLGDLQEIDSLIETRLVQKIDNRIGFPLHILAQWLAANALVKNYDLINDIVVDLGRLDKWYYPLIIVVSMFSYDDVKRVFSPVVQKNPGLAAQIVNEGIDISFFDKNNQIPQAKECGLIIREAYLTWMSGIGDLAKYIAPTLRNGKLQNIGVTRRDNWLEIAWNNGTNEIDEVTELPIGFFVEGLKNPGWYSVQNSFIGSQMAWPWRWSFDDLSNNLSKFISNKSLLVSNGFMYKERVWDWALAVMGYGDLYDNPINLDELELKLKKRLKMQTSGQYTQLDELSYYLRSLRENGFNEFLPLWPKSDKKFTNGGWIWDPYSDDQLLKRTIAIYSAALQEYHQIMTGLFVKLKPRMLIGTLLPVKMHGQLYFSKSQTFGRSPALDWYFEPLPLGSKNVVQFQLVEKPYKMIEIQELFLLNKRMRPISQSWLSSFTHHGGLDVFGRKPLTKIVYNWLENDLERINWV